MTIEGASAAAGHDKNGNLLGYATTDEIGSVMDDKKTKNETTNNRHDDFEATEARRRGRQEEGREA